MNIVCVVLGDNDFGNTFIPLLKSLRTVFKDYESITREQVTRMVKMGINYHYCVFQNVGEADPETYDYLSKTKVLFDEEALEFISDNDHDGGSWFLEVNSGKIESF